MVKNRARGVLCWLLQNATAGKESRMKGGGDKTKLHELIVGEHLSKQWGEPHRPHRSLGHLTPNKFVAQCQALQTVEEVVCSG